MKSRWEIGNVKKQVCANEISVTTERVMSPEEEKWQNYMWMTDEMKRIYDCAERIGEDVNMVIAIALSKECDRIDEMCDEDDE